MLLDEQALFRASLARFLASQPGFEVVGECGTSADALEILKASPVDVVLLDFDRSRGDPFIPAARNAGYQGRFLIVAGTADAMDAAVALKLGAAGIFLKSDSPDRLVQAILLVTNGAVWLDQKMICVLAGQLVDRSTPFDVHKTEDRLTDRERRVLLGILGGLTNRKIGDQIGVSEGSVKAVVQQLFYKAGVRTRSQLVRVALEGALAGSKSVKKAHSPKPPTALRFHEAPLTHG